MTVTRRDHVTMIAPLLTIVLTLTSQTLAEFELVILHTNDVHARFEQTNRFSAACSADDAAANNCYGGVARRYTAVEELRQQKPNNTILLDAGDQFQGTLWFSEYQGRATSYFMNLLGYDAMVSHTMRLLPLTQRLVTADCAGHLCCCFCGSVSLSRRHVFFLLQCSLHRVGG